MVFSYELYEYDLKDSMFISIQKIKKGVLTQNHHRCRRIHWWMDITGYRVFSHAEFIICEAQPDKQTYLEKVKNKHTSQVEYHIGLLGSTEKENVDYHLMETGSSVLKENTDHDRELMQLPMRTLDKLIYLEELETPCFLKLDVQDYEIEVLKGVTVLLSKVDITLLKSAYWIITKAPR